MTATFCYGRGAQGLLHVSDLEPGQARGLQCKCFCPECGRALQAHLGSIRAWHFQHHVEDVDCNPQPMTLLHAFVRDELARRKTLRVPAVKIATELEVFDETIREEIAIPA